MANKRPNKNPSGNTMVRKQQTKNKTVIAICNYSHITKQPRSMRARKLGLVTR